MNIKKIITFFVLSIVVLGNMNVFAEEIQLTKCINKKGYELYKCRVNNICLNQEYGKNKKKVTKLDKYYEEEINDDKIEDKIINIQGFNSLSNIDKAKKLYRQNQNKIYKCSVINSQILVFEDIKKLLNSTDKTGILKDRILGKINIKENKLRQISTKDCNILNKNSSSKQQIKKIVLDQSTLELCRYRYYLDYLDKKASNDLKDSFPEGKEYISAKQIGIIVGDKKSKIKKEVSHTFKVYPIAFDSYIQYDSFLKLHIILELLKEDYRILRDKIYLTISPINQLVYKIINAQSR